MSSVVLLQGRVVLLSCLCISCAVPLQGCFVLLSCLCISCAVPLQGCFVLLSICMSAVLFLFRAALFYYLHVSCAVPLQGCFVLLSICMSAVLLLFRAALFCCLFICMCNKLHLVPHARVRRFSPFCICGVWPWRWPRFGFALCS